MKIASNDVPGVSRILEVSLNRGESARALLERLEDAITRVYRPSGHWTPREYDIAFLAKALGGPRLLYALQQAKHFPSLSTLRRRKKLPQLVVSADLPTDDEINANITTMLGARPPPSKPSVGQTLMIDGIALEEVPRYDSSRNLVLGLCREHSHGQKKTIDHFEDLDALREGLNSGKWHYSKDGTVFALAPVTSKDHYYPTPVLISGSCKSENGSNIAELVRRFISCYNANPNGRERHGPILSFATDGESSFRSARFENCLGNPIAVGDDVLLMLPGFNIESGPEDLVGTCDPKHIFKRFAQNLRAYTLELQLGDTTITYQDIRYALLASGVPNERITMLLNPQDKQNVPIALDLLKELRNASVIDPSSAKPGDLRRLQAVRNYANIISLFVLPFTNHRMGLAEQVQSLSAYAHLVCALYRQHEQKFMKGALYADSMSIVKSIIVLVARYQTFNCGICLYIIQIGTDREEGVFSEIRTQDHSRNCDLLQLGQKSCISAEINRILQENPDLDRGHEKRSITTSKDEDHINPASLDSEANFSVDSVDLYEEYSRGRRKATELISEKFGWIPEWDRIWDTDRQIDLLRPFGRYVGSRSKAERRKAKSLKNAGGNFDGSDEDDEDEETTPSSLALNQVPHTSEGLTETHEEIVGVDSDQVVNSDSDTDDPRPGHSRFITIDGQRYYKSTVCAKYLISPSSRKVVIRQFRAAGMTIKDITQRASAITDDDSTLAGGGLEKIQLYNKDLGAALCRCSDGQTVALIVIEILHFKLGEGSGKVWFDVEIKDLESDGIRVIGQVMDLEWDCTCSNGRWVWTQKYLTPNNADGDVNQHLTVSILGSNFLPLRPGVKGGLENNGLTWTLDPGHLEKVSKDLWAFLDPSSDSILLNVDKLPRFSSSRIPYQADGHSTLVIDDARSVIVKKYTGEDTVACHFCGLSLKLKMLRNHVGLHILRSAREVSDSLLKPDCKVSIPLTLLLILKDSQLSLDWSKSLWMVWERCLQDPVQSSWQRSVDHSVGL
jgi:hypothetical protein